MEACSCEEEIFLGTVYRYSVGDWLWEAVFAVMSVTPHAKLSEEVLAAAVKLHYEQQGLPVGVAIQALEAFAADGTWSQEGGDKVWGCLPSEPSWGKIERFRA